MTEIVETAAAEKPRVNLLDFILHFTIHVQTTGGIHDQHIVEF